MDCGIFSEALIAALAALGAAALLREGLRFLLVWRFQGKFELRLRPLLEAREGEDWPWVEFWMRILQRMEYPEAVWEPQEEKENAALVARRRER